MRNKKGEFVLTEFLLRMVVAFLFLGAAVALGKSMFSVRSQGEDSFNDLYNLITEIEDGENLSMDFIMDDKTALIGFTKDADKFVHQDFLNPKNNYLGRPTSCESNKACLCLCTSISKVSDEPYLDEKRHWNYEYECKKIKCKSLESMDFLEKIDEDDFGSYPGGIDPWKRGNYYRLLNGFIHTRKGPRTFPGIPTRASTVYIKRYKTKVGVCFKSPCIPEEIINERIPVTIDEFSEINFMFKDGWMIGVDNDDDDILETFYYVEKIVKDNFDGYYYQYKFGNRPKSAPEQAGFLDVIQEKTKQDFESRFINYAKEDKLVEIDYNNARADIKSFEAETRMDEEGNVINV